MGIEIELTKSIMTVVSSSFVIWTAGFIYASKKKKGVGIISIPIGVISIFSLIMLWELSDPLNLVSIKYGSVHLGGAFFGGFLSVILAPVTWYLGNKCTQKQTRKL
jgi:membrane associated rhomboid family serine protease